MAPPTMRRIAYRSLTSLTDKEEQQRDKGERGNVQCCRGGSGASKPSKTKEHDAESA